MSTGRQVTLWMSCSTARVCCEVHRNGISFFNKFVRGLAMSANPGMNARLLLRTDYAYVLSQSIRVKDTERGFIYPIDKSLLCKMRSRTVRCAKLT